MDEYEWERLKNDMTSDFQDICGIDLRHLCRVDGAARPMRFRVGYDVYDDKFDRKVEFVIPVPKAVYDTGTSKDIAAYITSCFRTKMNENGGLPSFPAPSDDTTIWCDEI